MSCAAAPPKLRRARPSPDSLPAMPRPAWPCDGEPRLPCLPERCVGVTSLARPGPATTSRVCRALPSWPIHGRRSRAPSGRALPSPPGRARPGPATTNHQARLKTCFCVLRRRVLLKFESSTPCPAVLAYPRDAPPGAALTCLDQSGLSTPCAVEPRLRCPAKIEACHAFPDLPCRGCHPRHAQAWPASRRGAVSRRPRHPGPATPPWPRRAMSASLPVCRRAFPGPDEPCLPRHAAPCLAWPGHAERRYATAAGP
jgi:hypothetical protein